ncbi:Crp/Fnr family transcriptional regulator [Paenibacillus polymyxa]|uniref:Crp/Fnr family transcriptional regulator n=1 Tax=Paenibacillus TaxID=44249 RepID=UPI000EDCD19B|nr:MULTISPECIES: cyclic nucleotide-binding domain-containing protein [Paenibacillus]KAF6656911.1 cyclic nucleotide-binding domain-containing protein [Paenibacillus sp. EKM301P]RGL38246.1 Crp/Fnr family transcriptional regulator [Paenibacillus polymyxa]RPD97038.1 Crp/Fnr family transcriptional regulator [Paenibacillus polymyxa]UBS86933.1 cyclic nucleotide-binding domain-containing protein [Paenibacillus polymyxa]UMR35484.1 cyclic nucleotide-binding domain-containing protein [Paenibacillus polym
MREIQDQEQLKYFLHLHQLESILYEPLHPYLSLHRLEQGEKLCSQGDAIEHLYILVQGKVKIFTSSTEGKTLILCFKTPIEVIGDVEYIRNSHVINTVEAVSPIYVIGVHRQWMNKYGRDYAPLLQFLLDIVTRKFCLDSDFSNFNLMYPVEVRLASYLLSVSFDESNSAFHEELRASSLVDVANLIGTSYRHLNRVIRKMIEEGLVERAKGYIVIKDRKGLSELAGHNIYESL